MSETRNVTFMESVQLFDEMVVEKYFKTVDTEDLMLCIAGNADSSALHVTACGNSEYLVQALLEACREDKNIKRVVMTVAAKISMETLMNKLAKERFNPDDDNLNEEDEDD
jgi:hypothetical protein